VFFLFIPHLINMYLLRRAAARSLSAQASALAIKPRTLMTKTPASLRAQQWQFSSVAQRRFASSGSNEASPAEASTSGETVTTETTPAEQELKDQVQDKAEAVKEQAEPIQETLEETKSSVQETTQSVVDAVKEKAAAAAETVQETTRSAAETLLGRSVDREAGTFNEPKPSKIVYVGNLFFHVKLEDLQAEFSRFGDVQNCRIAEDPRGMSKGFGYVEFATVEEATKAIEGLDQQQFAGRRLSVQYHVRREPRTNNGGDRDARPRVPNTPSKTLFIGNMSFQMGDKDLNDTFKNIKNVIDVRVAIDRRSGQPRGFAHADFIDIESAAEAKKSLENMVVFGRQLRVDFSQDTRQPRERRSYNNNGEGERDSYNRGGRDNYNRGGRDNYNRGGRDSYNSRSEGEGY